MAHLVWRGKLFLAWKEAFGQEEGQILSSVTLGKRVEASQSRSCLGMMAMEWRGVETMRFTHLL